MKEDNLLKPEITFESGIPLPPSIRPVIILQGSDYDMGYQYYKQTLQIFGKWVATHYFSYQTDIDRSDPSEDPYGYGIWRTKELKAKEFSKKELNELDEYEEVLRKYAPEFIDFFKGEAAAATDSGTPLTYHDVLARFRYSLDYIRPDVLPELIARLKADTRGGCSGFAAWGKATTDGKLYGLGIGDGGGYFAAIMMVFPKNGNSYIASPEGILSLGFPRMHPNMNNKGLAFVHHGGGRSVDGELGIGINEGMAVLHTLRFANSAEEAEALQITYPLSNKIGGLWADVKGNAFCIECRQPKAIRRPGDCGERDFIYAANNCLSKDLGGGKGDNYIPHAGWIGVDGLDLDSVSRNLQMYNLLNKQHGKVDLEYVMMMLRDPGKPPTYPTIEAAIVAYDVTGGEGWDMKIGSIDNGRIGIAVPDDGDEGLYYVCNGSANRVAYPYDSVGFRYTIAPTYSFYQLKLAESPEKVATSARTRAQYDLYYASNELRKLNYLDNGYAALDEILNHALKDWFKGEYVLGRVVSGNESTTEAVYDYAKSTRFYTRCQALAHKVLNALIPPAIRPEDLGIRPWLDG